MRFSRKTAFLAILISLVAAGGIPLGLYLYAAWQDAIAAAAAARETEPQVHLFRAVPGTAWAGRRNLNVLFPDGTSVRTDGDGRRIGVAPPAEPADIVFTGGSLTWGVGVDFEQTFPYMIGRTRGQSVRVTAVPGYGTVQALLALDNALDPQTKVLVYGYWVDHLRRNIRKCALVDGPYCVSPPVVREEDGQFRIVEPSEAGNADGWRQWREEAFGPNVTPFNMLKWKAVEMVFKPDLARQEQELSTPESLERQYSVLRYLLEEMQRAAKRVDAAFVVVEIPPFHGTSIPAPDARVERICGDIGCNFFSLSSTFADVLAAGDTLFIPGDGHLNLPAQQASAEAVSAFLTTLPAQ